MKHILLSLILLLFILPAVAQMTLPRMYVQKLVLENGKNPSITWDKDKSANEYTMIAWLNTHPDEVISTETNPLHTIGIKQVGDGKNLHYMVIASVQLGNFKSQWKAGEVLHLELTHKKTGQKHSWRVPIPEGSALIKELEKPIVIPPFAKPKKKKC